MILFIFSFKHFDVMSVKSLAREVALNIPEILVLVERFLQYFPSGFHVSDRKFILFQIGHFSAFLA